MLVKIIIFLRNVIVFSISYYIKKSLSLLTNSLENNVKEFNTKIRSHKTTL
ncbi:hypothetical protein M949_1329 [Riemerella anatipestifer CH3]|nr:hypothetical protein M949_1329 [Riemerella anatipestifer CH3]